MMSGQQGGFDFSSSGMNMGGARRKASSQPKEDLDITKTLNVTAQEIFDRKPISVTFTEMDKCGYCNGGGYCSHCGGTGILSTPKTVKVKLQGYNRRQKVRLKGKENQINMDKKVTYTL